MLAMFLLAILFSSLVNLLIPFVWRLTEVNIKNHMQLFRYNSYKLSSIRHVLFLIPQFIPWVLQLLVILLVVNRLLKNNPLPAALRLWDTSPLSLSANVPLMSYSGFMSCFFWPLIFLILGIGIYFYLKKKYQVMKNENDLSLQYIVAKEDGLTILMLMQIILCNLFCYQVLKTCLKIVFLNVDFNLISPLGMYFLSYFTLIILARFALTEKLIWRVFFALITAGLMWMICYFSW